MDYLRLDEVCDLNMGQSPDSDSYNQKRDGIPFFQGNADFGEIYPITRVWCNKPKKIVDKGTLLISVRAPIGELNFAVEKSCIGRGLAGIIAKSGHELKYIYYALKYKNKELNNKGTGSTFKAISKSSLGEILIRDMPIENQRKCIEELDLVYKAIENKKEQIKQLDILIKSRFVEMFGCQSANEKGLPYGTIEDVAAIYLGITHTPNYVEEGIKFISAKNISGDFLDLSDVKYISKEEYEGAPLGAKPKKNDVLFSRVGSNLGHPVILDVDEKLCTFVSLGYLRPKNNMTSNYLKHWMRDDFFSQQVKEHVKGGGQPNLNTGWLKEFKIIVPEIGTQIEFEKFTSQVDKLKFEIQKSLDETQSLLDSLMQKYFG